MALVNRSSAFITHRPLCQKLQKCEKQSIFLLLLSSVLHDEQTSLILNFLNTSQKERNLYLNELKDTINHEPEQLLTDRQYHAFTSQYQKLYDQQRAGFDPRLLPQTQFSSTLVQLLIPAKPRPLLNDFGTSIMYQLNYNANCRRPLFRQICLKVEGKESQTNLVTVEGNSLKELVDASNATLKKFVIDNINDASSYFRLYKTIEDDYLQLFLALCKNKSFASHKAYQRLILETAISDGNKFVNLLKNLFVICNDNYAIQAKSNADKIQQCINQELDLVYDAIENDSSFSTQDKKKRENALADALDKLDQKQDAIINKLVNYKSFFTSLYLDLNQKLKESGCLYQLLNITIKDSLLVANVKELLLNIPNLPIKFSKLISDEISEKLIKQIKTTKLDVNDAQWKNALKDSADVFILLYEHDFAMPLYGLTEIIEAMKPVLENPTEDPTEITILKQDIKQVINFCVSRYFVTDSEATESQIKAIQQPILKQLALKHFGECKKIYSEASISADSEGAI